MREVKTLSKYEERERKHDGSGVAMINRPDTHAQPANANNLSCLAR